MPFARCKGPHSKSSAKAFPERLLHSSKKGKPMCRVITALPVLLCFAPISSSPPQAKLPDKAQTPTEMTMLMGPYGLGDLIASSKDGSKWLEEFCKEFGIDKAKLKHLLNDGKANFIDARSISANGERPHLSANSPKVVLEGQLGFKFDSPKSDGILVFVRKAHLGSIDSSRFYVKDEAPHRECGLLLDIGYSAHLGKGNKNNAGGGPLLLYAERTLDLGIFRWDISGKLTPSGNDK
jgi:hypothetical protein